MTVDHHLVGYVDPVGRDLGFLVPVFGHRKTNGLYTQRITEAGLIEGFEEVGGLDGRIRYVLSEPASIGEPSFWAFSFSTGDVVTGRIDPFRRKLSKRVDDEALASRPMLSIEVLEFLNMGERRLEHAKMAAARIRKRSPGAARNWLDLSILTPDLRVALSKAGTELRHLARRAVASVEADRVLVRYADLINNDSTGPALEAVVREVMKDLADLYPLPKRGWNVVAVGRPPRRPLPRPDAVVWFPEDGDASAMTHFGLGADLRIDAYGQDEAEEFGEALKAYRAPGFIFSREPQGNMLRDFRRDTAAGLTIIAPLGLPRLRLLGREFRLATKPARRVLVPVPNVHRNPPGFVPAMVRHVVAAMSANDRAYGDSDPVRGFAFIRATGTGHTPTVDAWAALYDRARSTGFPLNSARTMSGRTASSTKDEGNPHWARELLFPGAPVLDDRRLTSELSRSRIDAALLLSTDHTDHADQRSHADVVESVLRQKRWDLRTSFSPRANVVELERSDGLRQFDLDADNLQNGSGWDYEELLRLKLNSVDTATVAWEASAPRILHVLFRLRTLVVDMRDVCGSSPAGGIWALIGSQLRRLAGGRPNRPRSQLMGLLVSQSRGDSHAGFDEIETLLDAVHSGELGNQVQLKWSHVRQTPEQTQARVRLIASSFNEYLTEDTDIVAPFSIVLNARGVTLAR